MPISSPFAYIWLPCAKNWKRARFSEASSDTDGCGVQASSLCAGGGAGESIHKFYKILMCRGPCRGL
jgi:hypothetical protein